MMIGHSNISNYTPIHVPQFLRDPHQHIDVDSERMVWIQLALEFPYIPLYPLLRPWGIRYVFKEQDLFVVYLLLYVCF